MKTRGGGAVGQARGILIYFRPDIKVPNYTHNSGTHWPVIPTALTSEFCMKIVGKKIAEKRACPAVYHLPTVAIIV